MANGYSDQDFVIDFYKQGEQIQADLYRVRGAEPSYDLVDEITIGLIGEFRPESIDRVLRSWDRIVSIAFDNLGWGQATEPPIVAIGQPYRAIQSAEVYAVKVQVSYDFLESVRP